MKREEVTTFTRTDMWREGEWLDLWSVVHFLSGVSIGLGFYFLHFGTLSSALLVFVLLVAYEMWEVIVKIEETPTNRCMDVVVGMMGYTVAFFLLAPFFQGVFYIFAFGLIFITDIVLSTFGWHASRKAAVLQDRMLSRYTLERSRLLKKKLHLQKRFRR